MIKIQKLDANNKPVYSIENIKNYNDFIKWLYELDDKDMSLWLDGRFYRFKTVEERCQFVFGFQCASACLKSGEIE